MFNFRNYFSALFFSLTHIRNKEYIFTWRLFFLKIILFFFLSLIILINHVFILFDEIFLFFYRFTKINQPVMIIGVPRTGTTLLYRTMAEDRSRFTCFTFGEIVFAPSLIQKFIWYGVYRIDKRCAGPLKKLLLFLETKSKIEYDKIHTYGYFKPEEDELILLNLYSSIVLKYLFPRSKVFDKYIDFDEKLSPAEKRNIFHFQQRCIKKHLFFWRTIQGKQKIFLSKNPIYSPKIDSLFQFYPDVRMIVTSREPAEVIPSFISMNASVIKSLHQTNLLYPDAQIARDVIINWMEQVKMKTMQRNAVQIYACEYDLLITDIREMVCNIYRHFDFQMSEEFLDFLGQKLKEQQAYTSHHQYDLPELNKALGEN